MFEYILKIRTPITYTRANKVLKRVNELIGGFYLGLFVPAKIFLREESSTEEMTWETEEYEPFTWDNWEEDMKMVANEFPDIDFSLDIIGKKDWTIGLFKGAACQITHAIPPPSGLENRTVVVHAVDYNIVSAAGVEANGGEQIARNQNAGKPLPKIPD